MSPTTDRVVRYVFATLGVPVVAGVGACGPEVPGAGGSPGSDFVLSSSPIHPDTLVPELVATWGRVAGSDEQVFTEVTNFAIDRDGGLIVHDRGLGVRRFRRDGSFRGILARYGQGPTEVEFAPAIAAAADGRIAVWGMANGRLLVFDESGELLSSRSVPARYVSSDENSLFFDDDGGLWYKVALGSRDDRLGYPRPAFVRIGPRGRADTVFVEKPPSAECSTSYDATYRRGYWQDKRAPWFPVLLTAMGPDGSFAWACSSRFVVYIRDSDGRSRRIELPSRKGAITPEERVFFSAWQPLPALPSHRPDIARIILPGGGWAWLWPTQPPEEFDTSPAARRRGAPREGLRIAQRGAFEVIDPDGRWVGTVAVPEGVEFSGFPTTPPVKIRGDTIWAVRFGEFEEQYVSKYIVRWPETH